MPAHILRLAHAARHHPFGENKIQEAVGKREALQDLPIDWCIVGHLQTNKAKYLTRFAREFHASTAPGWPRCSTSGPKIEDRVLTSRSTSTWTSKYGLHP